MISCVSFIYLIELNQAPVIVEQNSNGVAAIRWSYLYLVNSNRPVVLWGVYRSTIGLDTISDRWNNNIIKLLMDDCMSVILVSMKQK